MHEQNGIVERYIKHIFDTDLTLLAHGHVLFRFWSYAFDIATSLINYMSTLAFTEILLSVYFLIKSLISLI